MGCGSSKAGLSAESGTEAEYRQTFEEKKVLGQGEFGIVKLVVKRNSANTEPYAVKVLMKGFVFKDNTLYTPMKSEVLKMEIDILRALGGQRFNLVLDSVYESSSKVYVITEVCAGGEMLEYTAKNMTVGLRTEDVSRIAHQLLSAVDHCDKHNIFHRDIKPENIMFKSNTKNAELRLIDFGCATMDEEAGNEHVTFAGTPFYISPEMFQKKYTTKTDVFSVGVVLYVLVAGYPSTQLQEAFNKIQKFKRDLKELPGMPEDMPETYYEMLDKMLAYRPNERKSAGELLSDDFVLFHKDLEKDKSPAEMKRRTVRRTQSFVLTGTGEKAAATFEFTKFHRAVTTILAAMMDRGDILSLVSKAEALLSANNELDSKLGVITVANLKKILGAMGKTYCLEAIGKQKNADIYAEYSYEYTILKPFAKKPGNSYHGSDDVDSSTRSMKARSTKKYQVSTKDLSMSDMGNRKSRMANRKSRLANMEKAQSVYIRGI